MIGHIKAHPMPAPRPRGMLILLLVTALPGCYRTPTRWDEVQAKTRRNAPAVSKEAVPGATFNKLFPKREAIQLPAIELAYGGGGIHSICLPQPAGNAASVAA